VTDRDAWFADLRDRIRAFYLADPADPYRQSGRSSGAARWALKRKCLVDAIPGPGAFMDVGCANGLLLESLRAWSHHALEPHGIDFVPELIELARTRHPPFASNFAVANAWDWEPPREYDFVRTNLEYVPEADWPEYVRRMARPARRLILCHYAGAGEPPVDAAGVLSRCGYAVAGTTAAPEVSVAWTDRGRREVSATAGG